MKSTFVTGTAIVEHYGSSCVGGMRFETPYILFRMLSGKYTGRCFRWQSDKAEESDLIEGMRVSLNAFIRRSTWNLFRVSFDVIPKQENQKTESHKKHLQNAQKLGVFNEDMITSYREQHNEEESTMFVLTEMQRVLSINNKQMQKILKTALASFKSHEDQKQSNRKRSKNFRLLRKNKRDIDSLELQKEVTKNSNCEAYQIHVFDKEGNEKGPQGEIVYWETPYQMAAICFGGGHPFWTHPSTCAHNAVKDFFNLPD